MSKSEELQFTIAFFSANELFSVSDKYKTGLQDAHGAGGRKLTAVDKARAKMAKLAEAKASAPLSSFSFFSENSVRAAQIAHKHLEEQEPETVTAAVTTQPEEKLRKSNPKGQGVKRPYTEMVGASHPCRANAPKREAYARGSEEGLDEIGLDDEAVKEVWAKELAATTVPSVEARWTWWVRRCHARRWQPLEITPRRLEIAAALLNKARYRSTPAYLSEINKRFIRAGGFWTQQLDQLTRSLNRALARGQGPPRKADEIPVEGIANLPKALVEQARTAAWPAAGVHVAVVNAAWLLREIESSAAVLSDVTLHEPDGPGTCGWAEWVLPASKTDPSAQGVTRALACACPSKLCPIMALRSVITTSEIARQMTVPLRDPERHPLICKADGAPLSKEEMVRFY